jgi:hypothetical protein
MKNSLYLGAAALAVLMGSSLPVHALTQGETEAVISIMEQLTDEIGETMSTESGDIFYDYDMMDGALIAAEGFSRESWIVAYDAVMSGYLAVIPEAQFLATFEEPLALLEASELPEDQKAMMREHVDGLMTEALEIRHAGAAYAELVRPHEQRLQVLVYGGN